ncbi:MAG TPA: DUF3419 family protein [Fimbriimonas sp.]|nr:DUF3419 family protein [Fimbriimonas sp.]
MAETPEVWKKGPLRGHRKQPEIMFGQVREDVALEASLARGSCLCIASGGDTALSLLRSNADEVTAIDVNPAQLYLVELKVAALRRLPYSELIRCMTEDARSSYTPLRDSLGPEAQAFFDARIPALRHGLQTCGKVDGLIAALARLLPFVHRKRTLVELLSQPTIDRQREFYRKRWNTWAWRAGLTLLVNQASLALAYSRRFGMAAGTNFGRYFLSGFDQVFEESPAASNPFVWQVFLSREKNLPLPDWLSEEAGAAIRAKLDRLTLACGDVADVLLSRRSQFDFASLTNILDGADLEYRRILARSLMHGVKDEGLIVIRSFFPSETGLVEASDGRLKRLESPDIVDRSVFCRHVEVLQVRQ